MPPLTNAERMKRYREKLKKDPDRYSNYLKKQGKLVKEKTKKIDELSEEEKAKQRKKWREQKQKRKQKNKKGSAVNNMPMEIPTEENNCSSRKAMTTPIIESVPSKKKKDTSARNRRKLVRKYNNALKTICSLKTALNTARKNTYRLKLKTTKEINSLKLEMLKIKTREEVLESSMKNIYKKCKKNKEKNILKGLSEDKIVKGAQKTRYVGQLLGLKGKIRKSKEKVTNIKAQIEMEKFFCQDSVSRCTAGKKECRTRGKKKEQIRYLTDSLMNLYKIYKTQGGKYSFSVFFKHKPFYCLSPRVENRETCLCIRHSNMELLFAVLKKEILCNYKGLKELLEKICCDIKSQACMNGDCKTCKKKKVEYKLKEGELERETEWWQWERQEEKYKKTENGVQKTVTTKKTVKALKRGSIATLIQAFECSLMAFKKHYYTWKHQQAKYQECINNLKDDEVLIICDFSENYGCKLAEEVQSMHFGASKKQITLHTGVIYWKKECQSFCTVADSNHHDPPAIWAHLVPVIRLAKKMNPQTRVIHFYSDGPSTQYKQKKNFYLHNLFTSKLDIDYSTWSFTESGHGKGAADAIGGAVKRALDRQVAYGKDITDGTQAFQLLLTCMKTVKCFYISDSDITNFAKLLPKDLTAIKGTMAIHQIISVTKDIIKYRPCSCFCGEKKGLCDCFSPQQYSFRKKALVLEQQEHETTPVLSTLTPLPQELPPLSPLPTLSLPSSSPSSPFAEVSNTIFHETVAEVHPETKSVPLSKKNGNTYKASSKTHDSDIDIIEIGFDENIDPMIDSVAIDLDCEMLIDSITCASPALECASPALDFSSFPDDADLMSSIRRSTESDFLDNYCDPGDVATEVEVVTTPHKTISVSTKDAPKPKISFESRLKANDIRPKKLKTKQVNKPVKTIVSRRTECGRCRVQIHFMKNVAKCISCKLPICLKCSQGQSEFDYICDTCLGE